MTPMVSEPLARPGERQRDGTKMAEEVLEGCVDGFPSLRGTEEKETAGCWAERPSHGPMSG